MSHLPHRRLVLALCAAGIAGGCSTDPSDNAAPHIAAAQRFPATRTEAVVDDYHGTQISDPYRWLEDQDAAETNAWAAEQNRVTQSFLAAIPSRTALHDQLAQRWNYPRYTAPERFGDVFVYRRNDGLQNQSVIYRTRALDGDGEVLLDPNAMSADGTVSVDGFVPTDDGKLAAYSVSQAGSDWQEWRVLDVATGAMRPDVVRWCKFGGAAWRHDGQGFFYTRFAEPGEHETYEARNEHGRLCYHALGTAQQDDPVVYERPDQPTWTLGADVTEDGRYLVIRVGEGPARNRIAYLDLGDAQSQPSELLWQGDAEYRFSGNTGDTFYFVTGNGAPRGRLVAVDLAHPDPAQWRELVPQQQDTLSEATIVADRFVLTYVQDAHHVVRIHALDGKLEKELALPVLGAVGRISGRPQDRSAYFTLSSFTAPTAVYGYDFDRGELTPWRAPPAGDADVVTEQVFYQSADGTRVPMFLVHRRGLKLDRSNPTLLYGYGGFDISLLPEYSVQTAVWVARGGLFAQPSLRGGGEYGEDWHHAGMREHKQAVFDDFIAAARYLIRNDYTRPEKLAITGRSNGGLLAGACLTQHPELFGAAIPEVGVLDMLRYHRFTIGWAWVPEYGSSEDPEMFPHLLAYSPLHNVKPGAVYPPTMVMTGDHDDRVLPGHSYKFAATLQRAQAGDAPILLRVETRAGHGSRTPTSKLIDAATDRLAFLEWSLRKS